MEERLREDGRKTGGREGGEGKGGGGVQTSSRGRAGGGLGERQHCWMFARIWAWVRRERVGKKGKGGGAGCQHYDKENGKEMATITYILFLLRL